MSLIDESYFIGKLTIPQLGQPAVVDNLNAFIGYEEPPFLQAALGFELWQDFMNGLAQDPIDPIWTALRDGADFLANGLWPPFQWKNGWMNYRRDWFIPMKPVRRMHWVGFLGSQPQGSANNSLGLILVFTVGQAGAPVAGTSTFTSSLLAGTQYTLERRGFGTMTDADVNINNNGQTITLLKPGDKFNLGEVFILHFALAQTTSMASSAYYSPLAQYVYYQYFRDNAGNLSAFGVVESQSENSTPGTGFLKMYDAYKGMSDSILKLWQYLELQNVAVYPSYDRLKIDYNFFKPINKYGF